eukprot:6231164-Pyramimonas_sp.AAC.2
MVTVFPGGSMVTFLNPICNATSAAVGDATTGRSFESFSSVGGCAWSSRPCGRQRGDVFGNAYDLTDERPYGSGARGQ